MLLYLLSGCLEVVSFAKVHSFGQISATCDTLYVILVQENHENLVQNYCRKAKT